MEKMRLQCLRSIVVLVYLAVFSSFGASPSNGQAGKGSIAGFVKDSSDAVLKGAQIKVQPSDLSATSDATGHFVMNGLEAGDYTVYFDYVGFATASKTVTVIAGQTASVDVKLTVSSVDLQVLVTAERQHGGRLGPPAKRDHRARRRRGQIRPGARHRTAPPDACTLAYWHKPLFSSGGAHGNDFEIKPVWPVLYDADADVVVNGHDHDYERFGPQTPDAAPDAIRGIRKFVVGTGGKNHRPFASSPQPNSSR